VVHGDSVAKLLNKIVEKGEGEGEERNGAK
jgi:hypothetical protein